MPIEFRCESCSKLLRTPDESAGKKAKCPQCGTIVDVPVGGSDQADTATPPETSQPFSTTPEIPDSGPSPFGTMGTSGGALDSENPYASPSLSSGVVEAKPTIEGELTHNKISFDQLLNTAWSITMDNLGPMATFGAVLFGVNIGLGIVNQVISWVANATGQVSVIIGAQLVSIPLNFVAQTWLGIVSILFCTRMARDRRADLNVLSQTGPYLGRALGLTIVLAGIFVLLAILFCGTPALIAWIITRDEDVTAISAGAGLIAFVIPFVLIMLNYMLSMFFVIDRRQGVFAAMGMSRRFMRGNKMTAFLTMLVMQILGGIFVMCTCCVGRIIYDPFSILVLALMYLTATGQPFEKPLK
ncbi:MAG: hypothetical protein QGH33_19715 [Pirellulaceae bacterium]|nr:hypothetical protein [Pirellulaceae bacterium]